MDPNIIILAGGISSRMKQPASSTRIPERAPLRHAQERSKSMIVVGPNRRPFLDFLLYNVSEAGYRNVVLVVGDRDNSVRDYYGKGQGARQWENLNLSFVIQSIPSGRTKPLGTADALLRAMQSMSEWKRQSFTVCNSDNLYSRKAFRLLLEDHHANALIDYDRSALLFDHERIAQFAVIKKDADGFLLDIIEKPTREEILTAAEETGRIGVSMNIFRFSYSEILPYVESVPLHPERQEKELPIAVKMMVANNPRSVFAIPLSEHVIDLTSPSDIAIVKEYLAKEFQGFQR